MKPSTRRKSKDFIGKQEPKPQFIRNVLEKLLDGFIHFDEEKVSRQFPLLFDEKK